MIEQNFIKLYEDSFKHNWSLPALTDYGTDCTLYYKDLAKEIARLHILFDQLGVSKGSKISIVGRNLWIIHKNLPYADPETRQGGGVAYKGNSIGTLPTTRDIGVNVTLKF